MNMGNNEEVDVLNIPGFGVIEYAEPGKMCFRGTDRKGRRVYTVASKGSGGILGRVLKGFSDIYSLEPMIFVNMNKYNDLIISIGIFIARRFSPGLGKTIAALGIGKVRNNVLGVVESNFHREIQ